MASQIVINTALGVLDLLQNAEVSFYITRQIFDLNNFETRKSDFTKYIDLPDTPNNRNILGLISSGGGEQGGAQKIACTISMGGVMIAPSAFLLVGESGGPKGALLIRCQVLYGNFNFFDAIEGRDISQINWAEFTTDWTAATVRGNAIVTYDLPLICTPVADWMDRKSKPFIVNNNGRFIDIDQMGFFMFARTIITRMARGAGYTLRVDESTPEEFDKIALACPITKFLEPETFEGTNPVSGLAGHNNGTLSTVDDIENTISFSPSSDPHGYWVEGPDYWLMGVAQPVEFEIRGTYTLASNPSFSDSKIMLYQNGIVVAEFLSNADQSNPALYEVRATVNVNIGDQMQARIVAGGSGPNFAVLSIYDGTTFGFSTLGASTNRTVNVSDWMPKIGQADFLANILKLYNLFLVTDDITKELFISSFDKIYNEEALDFTDLVNVGAGHKALYSVNSVGKDSLFQWQSDDLLRADFNENIEYKNSLLAREVVTLDMIFSACDLSTSYFNASYDVERKAKLPLTNIESENVYASDGAGGFTTIDIDVSGNFTISSVDGQAIGFEVGNYFYVFDGLYYNLYKITTKLSESTGTVQTPIDMNNLTTSRGLNLVVRNAANTFTERLAVVRTDGGESNYYYGQGSSASPVFLGNAAQTATWPASLLMTNITKGVYKNILDAFALPVVLQVEAIISTSFMANYDLRKPIYLAQFNGFYYINKIEQFKLNAPTRLELIRISVFNE